MVGILSSLKRVTQKREVNYFKLFIESIDITCQVADLLCDLVQKYDNIEGRIEEIHQIEHKGDTKQHQLRAHLNRAFITPIEREDIFMISDSIDNITDQLEDVSRRFWMFNIQKPRPEALKTVKLISECCQTVKKAIQEFENFKKSKKLHDLIVDISRSEEQGDKLYHQNIRNLYTSDLDSGTVQVWREIFHDMEECFDACQSVAKILESAAMKNS